MTSVLITGFGRFPGAPFNPSGPLVRALAKRRRPAFADVYRAVHIFETSYAAVDRDLPGLIAKHKPDILLMFGLAARTPFVRIETRARNTMSILFPGCERPPAGGADDCARRAGTLRAGAVSPSSRNGPRVGCTSPDVSRCGPVSLQLRLLARAWKRPDPERHLRSSSTSRRRLTGGRSLVASAGCRKPRCCAPGRPFSSLC
jgi:hypothetical protein